MYVYALGTPLFGHLWSISCNMAEDALRDEPMIEGARGLDCRTERVGKKVLAKKIKCE